MTTTTSADDRLVGATHLPRYDEDAAPAVPRGSLGRMTVDEKFVRIGSWVSAFALSWLITQQLLPMPGLPWFLIVWFGAPAA